MTLDYSTLSPKQIEFFKAKTPFVAYGGARGGGKSFAVRYLATALCLKYCGIKILIMRRTYSELNENHILPMCSMLNKIVKYTDTSKSMVFPNGSRIVFGYCDAEKDVLRYQGQEYDIIFIDEATQMTEMQFKTLTACNRGANDFPKRMYLTCNAGGVGHAWVKRLFIDREYTEFENPNDYTFIQAKVTDNKALMEKNPQYIKTLEALPNDLKRAWLEGDWDALAGQYFQEFRKERHTCEPFEIPQSWRRYVAFDYGLDMLACYWCAFSPKGECYIYRELYQDNLIVSEASKRILDLSQGEDIFEFIAPSDLWGRNAETGKSQAEVFNENGLYLSQVVAKSRVDGWMNIHEWLTYDKLKIFNTCPNLIRCFPLVQHDEHKPNDIANEPHELTHSCLTGNTLVLTPKGEIPIKDLEEGMCYCLDENGKLTTSTHSKSLMTRRNANVYEIVLEDGSRVRATADHKFLTADGWKELKDLTLEDDLIKVSNRMKIKSITSAGKEDVYNICVDKYHNFVLANGIVVKNCDAVRYLLSGRPCPKAESNVKVSTLPYALRTEADNPPQEYWEQTANIKEESYW